MQKNGVQDLSQYISYALSVTGPPDFGWRTRDVEVPPDAMALSGFTPLLIDFYRQANLAELWNRSQPAYDKEMEKYHSPLVVDNTTAVDGYLRVPAGGYLGRRFQVFVDLLGAPEQVQTRNYGDDAFVIVTPSEKPRIFDIRHAYLHFEIDPIAIKYGMELDQKRSLLDFAQTAPLEPNFKNDFVLLANESLIKAVESRLDKNPAEIDQAARQGYILAPFFAEQLPVFEKQQQGMRFYLADMIAAIDLKREDTRIAGIKFDAAPLVRLGKQVTVAAPEPKLSPSAQTLEKAEELYLKRSLEDAKKLYLQISGTDRQCRRTCAGMVRSGAHRRFAEPARRRRQAYSKRLSALRPTSQTKAWTLVYLARLCQSRQRSRKGVKVLPGSARRSGCFGAGAQSRSNRIAKHSEIIRRFSSMRRTALLTTCLLAALFGSASRLCPNRRPEAAKAPAPNRRLKRRPSTR